MNDNNPEKIPKSELEAATFKPEVPNPGDSATSPVFAPEGMNPENEERQQTPVERELGRLATSKISQSEGTQNQQP